MITVNWWLIPLLIVAVILAAVWITVMCAVVLSGRISEEERRDKS